MNIDEFSHFISSLFRSQGYKLTNLETHKDPIKALFEKNGKFIGVIAFQKKKLSPEDHEMIKNIKMNPFFNNCTKIIGLFSFEVDTELLKTLKRGINEVWDRSFIKKYLQRMKKEFI